MGITKVASDEASPNYINRWTLVTHSGTKMENIEGAENFEIRYRIADTTYLVCAHLDRLESTNMNRVKHKNKETRDE